MELFAVAIVLFFALYTITKKSEVGESVAFLSFGSKFPFVMPGPMLSPTSSWGPRVDSSEEELPERNLLLGS